MAKITRREFVKRTVIGAAGAVAGGAITESLTGKVYAQEFDPKKVVIVENRKAVPSRNPRDLVEAEVHRMLDAALFELTGKTTRREAWETLGFVSTDRVGLKVNGIGRNYHTNKPMVSYAIAALIELGVAENNIIIFDRRIYEAARAGYPPNSGSQGIRVVDEDHYGWDSFSGPCERLSRIVTRQIDKLVNFPVLKDHIYAGLTFALKNHYGATGLKPHGNNCAPGIANVNGWEPIREKQKIILGEALFCVRKGGPQGNITDVPKKVIVGVDPVAVDYHAFQMLNYYRRLANERELSFTGIGKHIGMCRDAGVGTWEGVEYKEIDITDETSLQSFPLRRERITLSYSSLNSRGFRIPYQVNKAGEVKIRIYNTLGQLIKEFHLGYQRANTRGVVLWDGKDTYQNKVSSGNYFVSIYLQGHHQSKQILMLK
jgi:uncharacterized protein (DUF362 family)